MLRRTRDPKAGRQQKGKSYDKTEIRGPHHRGARNPYGRCRRSPDARKLGFVFSVVVLINDAAAFLAINIPGTVITVLLKGTLAGFLSGIVYNLLKKWALVFKNLEKNKESWQINLGVVVAAIVCPVVNTGIFLLGCVIFFLPTIREWGAAAGYENVGAYMLYGFVGGNFLFELLFNLILSPVIVQIIRIGQRSVKK